MLAAGVCSADDPSREPPRSPVPRSSWEEGSAGEVTAARTGATTEETAARTGAASAEVTQSSPVAP